MGLESGIIAVLSFLTHSTNEICRNARDGAEFVSQNSVFQLLSCTNLSFRATTGQPESALSAPRLNNKETVTGDWNGLDYARLGRLTSLDKLASSIERRRVRRLKTRCEVELTANAVSAGQRRSELVIRRSSSSAGRTISVPQAWAWCFLRPSSTSGFAVARTG
jgi:hypothetical protein